MLVDEAPVDLDTQTGEVVQMHHAVAHFYALAACFMLFILFLYGPMFAIYLLSFQGPRGCLSV
jgi:ABC-type spermidine/putrescine transport system permease subunit II